MIKEYFDAKAPIWDEKIAERNSAKLEAIAQRTDIEPGSAVLDVGTGTGIFVPYILSKISSKGRLVCLDLSHEMLKRCMDKGFSGNIDYICGDIADSGALEDKVFDSVVCYSSFPHFQNKQKALEEIYRVLKTGGKLFISHTSSRRTINAIHSRIPEVRDDLIPDENEMRRLLTEAGFTKLHIEDSSEHYMVIASSGE